MHADDVLSLGLGVTPPWKLVGQRPDTDKRPDELRIAGRVRCTILISGGTGSGKTTLLNALSRMIDHGERVVTIEDAAELQMQQPHVVRLETRPPNLKGQGEITMRELVKNALRMRPDRIILDEMRGAEAIDMPQASRRINGGPDHIPWAKTGISSLRKEKFYENRIGWLQPRRLTHA